MEEEQKVDLGTVACIDGDDPILKQVKSSKEIFSLELKAATK